MSILESLIEIPANNRCPDCGNRNTSWASINNGIFLCTVCALKHSKLSPAISFVKEIRGQGWSENRLKHMENGGNERFLSIVSTYYLSTLPLEKRYNSPVLHWYRAVLKAEIEGTSVPEAPPIPEDPILINYSIEDEETRDDYANWVDEIKEKAHEAENSARTKIQKTADTVKNIKNSVVEEFEHIKSDFAHIGSDFYDKSKEIGSSVIGRSLEVGNSIYKASSSISQEILHSEPINYIQEKTSGFFNKAKDKLSPTSIIQRVRRSEV